MKTFSIAILSFLLGAIVAGTIGFKMFIGLTQMGIMTEMNTHSVSIDLLSENKHRELQQSNCFVLARALENYAQFQESIWAIDNAGGTPEMTKELLAKVKIQIQNRALCKNT